MNAKVEVDAEALRKLLEACVGPGHHIRELIATMTIGKIMGDHPICILLEQYEAEKAKSVSITWEQEPYAYETIHGTIHKVDYMEKHAPTLIKSSIPLYTRSAQSPEVKR